MVPHFSTTSRRLLLAVISAIAVLAGVLVVVAARGGESGQRGAPAAIDVVIAAAGDIACDPASKTFNNGEGSRSSCHQRRVSDLLLDPAIDRVLALGDTQYYCGGKVAFQESYDPSWGRVKDKTLPAVGNHEYIAENDEPENGTRTGCDAANEGAAGYFDYFGAVAGDPRQGWYSVDLGAWHLVALNTNCSQAGGCGKGSPQAKWLMADLEAHPNRCTLAFNHHPASARAIMAATPISWICGTCSTRAASTSRSTGTSTSTSASPRKRHKGCGTTGTAFASSRWGPAGATTRRSLPCSPTARSARTGSSACSR